MLKHHSPLTHLWSRVFRTCFKIKFSVLTTVHKTLLAPPHQGRLTAHHCTGAQGAALPKSSVTTVRRCHTLSYQFSLYICCSLCLEYPFALPSSPFPISLGNSILFKKERKKERKIRKQKSICTYWPLQHARPTPHPPHQYCVWLHPFSFQCSVAKLWPHGLQHTKLPCPFLSPWVSSNSCPLSQWCHPAISSFVIPFSSHPQSFPPSGSFPLSQHFASDGQSIGASASASVLPMNIQGWFPFRLTGLISLLFKGLSRVFSNTTVQKHQFFGTQPSLWSNFHIRTWLLEKT